MDSGTLLSATEIALQTQIDLLQAVIKEQMTALKTAMKQLEEFRCVNESQAKEIVQLKDEIRRLKDLKTKPKIRPSKMNKGGGPHTGTGNGGKRSGSKKQRKTENLIIHKKEIIKATNIPKGSHFKGYREYVVQGLEIKSYNLLYKLERWQLPDGSYRVAELPVDIKNHHFSAELRAYILHQHHHQGVTQPLLLAQLREWGVEISSGQLNRILIENKTLFHQEKQDILTAGLAVSDYIQVDDTGARHKGKNGYCTHIGNELFGWFESTGSKSRINFLQLLRQERTNYLINNDALSYMKRHKLAPKYLAQLSAGIKSFTTKEMWEQHLLDIGLTTLFQKRIATEGALIGSILAHGFRMHCAIISDDAGQFNIFQHALCWIHAERKINELNPHGDACVKAVSEIRDQFWILYRELKDYKAAPLEQLKKALEKQFDELFNTKTCFHALNVVLKRLMRNKKELLLVLDRPEIPLHNNLSENDIREYVKKRKISGSTRSDEGRKCRDTFTSLKKTCKKLGIKFWDYLCDRLADKKIIPALCVLIEQKAKTQKAVYTLPDCLA